MERTTLETIGQYTASIGVFGYALIKGINKAYQLIKDFINKPKDKDKDKTNVTVNVGTCQPPENPFPKIDFPKDDYRYFLYFLLEQGKILKAMHDMRYDILRDQMEYFNKHIQDIKLNVTASMMKVLYDLYITDAINEAHYEMYLINFENFLEVSENKMTQIFRRMCKANHFSEYTNSEYRELIQRNLSIIEGTVSDLIRKRYPQRDFIQSMPNLDQSKTMIRNGIRDCFEYARDCSIAKETKVRNAKECFEQQVSDIIGTKYSLEI